MGFLCNLNLIFFLFCGVYAHVGFFLFSGDWIDGTIFGCFKFLTGLNLVWYEAQQKCEIIGGYLAEPKTAW
jgi:hypothetical protein